MYFVNLPIRTLLENKKHLNLFIINRLNPEIGIDAASLDNLPLAWHKELATQFKNEGLSCSSHLPFVDLNPGSIDSYIRNSSQDRLKAAIEIANLYNPHHFVAHLAYDYNFYSNTLSQWCERACESWVKILANNTQNVPLYLENTFETNPEPLIQTLKLLNPHYSNVGVCFDVGHWHSFAQGRIRNDFSRWTTALGTNLKHLHLHDNDGSFDQHLGMGQGLIHWNEVFKELKSHPSKPSITFEPHSEEAIYQTMEFLKNRLQSEMDLLW